MIREANRIYGDTPTACNALVLIALQARRGQWLTAAELAQACCIGRTQAEQAAMRLVATQAVLEGTRMGCTVYGIGTEGERPVADAAPATPTTMESS